MEDPILKTATVPETAGVASDIDLAITTANIDDAYLESQRLELKTDADTMTNGIGTDLANKSTMARDNADVLRGNLLTAFIYQLKGYLLWQRPEIQAAANRLMRIIEKHGGNFSKRSREIETGLYDALLIDLKKRELLTDLATLNLSLLVTDMDAAETSYKILTQQVATENSDKANYIAPSSIKREVQAKIDNIAGYLTAMAKAKPNVYGALTGRVAQLIETLNQKVRNRGNSKPGDNIITENK